MSRVISTIFSIAGTVIGGILGGPLGAVIGATIGQVAGALVAGAIAGSSVPPPEQAQRTVKTERPPRVRGYGITRRYPAILLFEAANGTSVDVGAYHDGRANRITRVYLNDDQVTLVGDTVQALPDKAYQSGKVKVGYTLGQAPGTWFSAVGALVPSWTSDHRGDGSVLAYMLKGPEKDKYFLETYPQGDNVQLSLVGEWTLTFDPRDAAQDPYDPSTWTFSENAVRAFVHYLMTERGFDWNTSFEPQRARVIAAMNNADEVIALAAGGTEPRYRTALTYKATDEPASIISSLLACFDGWYCVNERREVVIHSGAYYEPTVTIGPDIIVSFRHQAGVAAEDRVNTIAVPYVSSLHDYGTVDGQPWTDEDDIAARGKEVTAELGAQVPSHTQGRRLAKAKMARQNASDRGTVTTTFAGRAAMGERFIRLRLIEGGATFFDGVAEIVSVEREPTTGGVTFEWVKADPNAYAWNPATEDGEPAPVEARVARAPLTAPTILSATASFADATDNGTGVRVAITATDPSASGTTWFARWRASSSGVWVEQEFPDQDPGPGVSLLTGFVPVTEALQVQVEYRSSDGRLSGWSATATVDTRTDRTAPDAATAPVLASWTDTLRLTVARIARASSYRWRIYASDGTTLIRTIATAVPEVSYTAAQALADGARRAYVVKVAGVNGGGVGGEAASATLSKPAPAEVTSPAIAGGATDAIATCDATTGATGYAVFYAASTGFDPATTGGVVRAGIPSIGIYSLAAGTYYGLIAAYDEWTSNPALLNLSDELSFTITTGGGVNPSGGGPGGGGWGGGGGAVVIP